MTSPNNVYDVLAAAFHATDRAATDDNNVTIDFDPRDAFFYIRFGDSTVAVGRDGNAHVLHR